MTDLEAVNQMLLALSGNSVTGLDEPHPDVTNCIAMLAACRKQVLGKGTIWNIDRNVTLTPDVDGNIYLPQNALDCNVLRDTTIVKRGRRLYQSDGGTFTFTEPVSCDITMDMELDDLPEVLAQNITAMACRRILIAEDGDTTKVTQYTQEMEQARRDTSAADTRASSGNIFRLDGVRQNLMRMRDRRW